MAHTLTEAVRLLVVSREPSVLRPLWSIGEANSWHLETAGSGWEALDRIQAGALPDLLLLELPRGDGDSLHVLRWLRRLRPELPIILLSHQEDVARGKEAVRLGAHDFLVQPLQEKQLESAIRRHLNSPNHHAIIDFTSEDIEPLGDDTFFVGASPAMQKLRAQAELLAQANVPVLIVGEPGSGRDTTALLIHKRSVRSGFRFLKVNCAALPADLLAKELFGYPAGLSNDLRSSPGKFELCDKGTLFLDEIAEMPTSLQETLLHVMQEKQLLKPGTHSSIDVDVRVLAATDMNIERALSQKRLREDLYYRLSAFTVHVPALRQRKDEISLLLQHFMHKLARHYGLPARDFSPAVLDACQSYLWPGNVRELENFVKRYLMIGEEEICLPGIDTGELTEASHSAQVSARPYPMRESAEYSTGGKSLKCLIHDVKSEAERNAIATALEKTGWNRKAAARLLKVSYRTMLYKIEQYQMSSSDAYGSPFGNGTGLKGNGNGLKGNGGAR